MLRRRGRDSSRKRLKALASKWTNGRYVLPVCYSGVMVWHIDFMLMAREIVKVQAVQGRSEFGPEYASERDYDTARYQQDDPAETS